MEKALEQRRGRRHPFHVEAASGCPLRRQDQRIALCRSTGDAIEEPLAPQVELRSNDRGRRAEDIVEVVDGDGRVGPVVAQHDRGSVPCRHVDPVRGPHRGREDEVADAVEPQGFAEVASGVRIEPGQDILVVPDEIEGAPVEERRGDVRRQAVQLPRDAIRAGDIPRKVRGTTPPRSRVRRGGGTGTAGSA